MGMLKNDLAAAIDIGSNSIRMKIVEIKNNGRIIPLEDLRKTINLGRDSFSYGIIKSETVQKTCEILNDYHMLLKEYKVKVYRAVSTSAIREAENCDYILEQIRTKTGIDVEIINNAQERFYTYKGIRDKIQDYTGLRSDGVLVLDIGSGGVEASVYKHGHLNYTENIKVGSLRLREILHDLERKTLDFPNVMDAFVESRIYLLKSQIRESGLKNMIGIGGELKVISVLCNHKLDHVVRLHKQELIRLFGMLKSMSTQNIVQKYGIASDRAEILLPSVIVFIKFLELVDSEVLLAPLISLRDGLVADIADNKLKLKRKTDFQNDIIHSLRYMGRKYHYDEPHSMQVERLALTVFDGTRKLHGLKDRERFYLQMAAILHDIGKFVSMNQHHISSYNLITQSNIIGLSDRDLEIVANIAKFHSEEDPSRLDESYRTLEPFERIIVSKLSAILQLADSLDISHKQCVKALEVTTDEDLIVKAETDSDMILEQWVFENKAQFFYEVFGEKPIIKKKGR